MANNEGVTIGEIRGALQAARTMIIRLLERPDDRETGAVLNRLETLTDPALHAVRVDDLPVGRWVKVVLCRRPGCGKRWVTEGGKASRWCCNACRVADNRARAKARAT